VNRRAFVDDAACAQWLASLISPSCTDRQRAPPNWALRCSRAQKHRTGVPGLQDLRQNFVPESANGQTKTPHQPYRLSLGVEWWSFRSPSGRPALPASTGWDLLESLPASGALRSGLSSAAPAIGSRKFRFPWIRWRPTPWAGWPAI